MNFIKRNWRLAFGLYVFIYLPLFFYLEKTITMDSPQMHILNSDWDNYIPFCRYFIVPYVLWFVYILGSCAFMLCKATDAEYIRFALSLIIGMSLSLLIFVIYPSGLTIRPSYVPDDIFGKMVKSIYASDTPANVFPSIHVYNSIAIHIALSKCQFLANRKGIRISSFILCTLICISTLFVRQHSIADVIGGIVLMIVMYVLIYVVDYNKLFKKSTKELRTAD